MQRLRGVCGGPNPSPSDESALRRGSFFSRVHVQIGAVLAKTAAERSRSSEACNFQNLQENNKDSTVTISFAAQHCVRILACKLIGAQCEIRPYVQASGFTSTLDLHSPSVPVGKIMIAAKFLPTVWAFPSRLW
jgi:hypothetical protein